MLLILNVDHRVVFSLTRQNSYAISLRHRRVADGDEKINTEVMDSACFYSPKNGIIWAIKIVSIAHEMELATRTLATVHIRSTINAAA